MTAILVPPLATENLGRLDFGGINMDGVTSDIHFVPNMQVPHRSWVLNQSITYGCIHTVIQVNLICTALGLVKETNQYR